MWQLFAGFCSGVFFIFTLGWLPLPVFWLFILSGVAAVPLLTRFSSIWTRWFWQWFPSWVFFLAFVVGAGYGQLRTSHDFQNLLPESLNSHNCSAVGVISGLPDAGTHRTRFHFTIETLSCQAGGQGGGQDDSQTLWRGSARLSWHSREEEQSARYDLQPGQRWQLCVRLKRPHGFASEGASDYEVQLLRQGIGAVGYVRDHKVCHNQLLEVQDDYAGAVDRWRNRLSLWLAEHLQESAGSALVRGLLVGDSRGLDSQQWQLYRQTGTVHLLVISGLHVSLVTLFCWWLVRGLAWLGCLPLSRMALPHLAVVIGLLAAWCYGGMAGFGVPVQRALVMLSVGAGTLLLGFRPPLSTVYLLALTAVLLLNPWVVTAAGFWLSFLAVAGLLYLFAHRHGGGRSRRWLAAQWLMTCLLAPLLANLQQTVSPWSPLLNLVSIPLVGGLLVPLLFIGLLLSSVWQGGGVALLQFGAEALSLWQEALSVVAQNSHAFELPVPGYLALPLALFAIAVLFMPKALGWRWLGIPLLLPWLLPVSIRPAIGTVEITVLDVGQGLSVLARTHSHSLLYDTGDRFSPEFSAAQAVIVPFLRHKRVASPDRIVISHGDRDHIGGLELLQTRYPQTVVDTPFDAKNYCPEGESWTWDGVRFTFLGAGTTDQDGCSEGPRNDCSCVLQICAGLIADWQQVNSAVAHNVSAPEFDEGIQECALLTGDISWRRERKLLESYGGQLHSRLLLAPHHGSRSSSSQRFLAAVRPEWVSCSAGYANRFGHPAAKAMERLSAIGSVLVTAQTGTQTFILGDSRMLGSARSPVLYREGLRWWRRPES